MTTHLPPPTPHPPPARRFFPPHPRTWTYANAWKLAALTALTTFLGVFIAVTLSLLLRPTRSYFFPLLSDVDKHHPERFILRLAALSSTLLLVATTTATLLHSRSLKFFRPAHPHADHPQPHLISAAETIRPVDLAFRPHPRSPPPDPSTPTLLPARRRRLSSLHVLIFVPILLTLALTLTSPFFSATLAHFVTNLHLPTIALYLVSFIWCTAMCFLVWYFLKLQSMPDRALVLSPSESPPASTTLFPDASPAEIAPVPTPSTYVQRLKTFAAWLIMVLRPICLTGQVVCVIKIVGLWLALDTFSISNIRLVKRALLAALAFAEYTAAFFFAFFMTILAVDMRAKAVDCSVLQT